MPAVLKIDPQRRIVVTSYHSRVTGEDIVRQQSVILADPHFEPNFADVADFSMVRFAEVSESALRTLAGTRSIFEPGVPHVIIAADDQLYELGLKFRELAETSRPNLHVVRTLGEARRLLDTLGYHL